MIRHLVVRLVRAVVVVALVVPIAGVAPASAEPERGYVVVRLTLEGPVPPTHTFAIRCVAIDEPQNPCFSPESIVIACSPPHITYDYKPCRATTYEFLAGPFVGQTIEYEVLRWTTPDHSGDASEVHLPGSLTVHGGRQVISLTFDYSLAPAAPVLPDTAMPSL